MQSIGVGTDSVKTSREFRLLWLAALPGGLAMGAVGFAVFVQAYELTGSPAAVGAFGFVQFAALLIANGGPRLVDLSGGIAASVWGATASAAGGGAGALAGVLLYTAVTPALLRYRFHEGAG